MRVIERTFVGGVFFLVGLLVVSCAPWRDEPPEATGPKKPVGIPKSEMKNPWARAKVGDYILVRETGTRHLKIEVVKANDIEVLVHVGEGDDPEDYTVYNLQEEERNYRTPEQLDGFVSMVEAMEDVGGKKIRVKIITLQGQGNTIVNTISDQVPLDGVIRSVRNDAIGYDIIDFLKN